MKRFLIILIAGCILNHYPADAQSFLKKVTRNVTNEILGKTSTEKTSEQPEPACACSDAELILDLSGTLKLDYKEISISIKDDGSLLVKDRTSSKYYVVKAGVTNGPYEEGDPAVTGFEAMDEIDNSKDAIPLRYKDYVKKSGEKLTITFAGKSYGPYAILSQFAVSASKDKFAAIVTESVTMTEAEAKIMQEAMKNAKNDQERMDLSMKYAQQLQQKMSQSAGQASLTPKIVTNIPNATFDPMQSIGGMLNGKVKFDDIVMVANDKIIDMQGKTILTLKQDAVGSEYLFVNTSNTKYAWYKYGTLSFSDNAPLAELFNPHLLKADGKLYLAYMYYSPKRNAIMQCKVVF
jgi:hypothetical protein